MSCHRALAAGLMAAALLLPGFLRADEPPPGTPKGLVELFRRMQSKSDPKSLPLAETLEGSVAGFQQGRAADAEAVLNSMVATSIRHESFPLYLLTLGSVELSLGDYQSAASVLTAATTNLSVELSSTATGIAIIHAESERPYRGYPHEKMLARTYLGLAYFQQSKYEDARIEFAKAREEDRGKEMGQDNDFTTGHFLEGLNSLRDRRYNDAQVSFRKVTELKQDWPLGWYAVCRASELAREAPEADEAWSRYEALTPAEARLARDGSTPCALFLVESGWGPVRKPDKSIKELGAWEAAESSPIHITLGAVGQPRVDAPSLDDLYFQASTTGGKLGEAARKLVSSAAKGIVRGLLPGKSGDLLAGKSEVDLRCWADSPGMMHLAAVPLPAQSTSVELICTDKSGRPIGASHQVFHYLRGLPFGEAPLVYARILPGADARATLHGHHD